MNDKIFVTQLKINVPPEPPISKTCMNDHYACKFHKRLPLMPNKHYCQKYDAMLVTDENDYLKRIVYCNVSDSEFNKIVTKFIYDEV